MWFACDPNSERNTGEKKVGLDDKNIPAHIRDISKQSQVPGSSPVSVQNHEAFIIEELKPREGQWQAEDHTASVWDHFQAGKSVFQLKPQSLLCGGFIFRQRGSALVSVLSLEVGQRNQEPRSCQGWSQAPGGWEPKLHTHVNTEPL